MLTKQLKDIKEAIKDLKSNRSYVLSLELAKRETYAQQIAEYDATNYFEAQSIVTLEERFNCELNKLYDDFGMDVTIQIIYTDGSECNVTGEEIIKGVNPTMQHIAYACYSDAYTEYDTLTGCLDNIFQHGEKFEEREEYGTGVEIMFNTAWGKRHGSKN
jgi:hypothetical protein